MRSGVGLGPVPGLCLLAKRRERRFPEAEQSIATPRSADYPKIAAGFFGGAPAKFTAEPSGDWKQLAIAVRSLLSLFGVSE